MNKTNLLVGNGINIQFDNFNYTTQQIVLRILKNCDRDDFPAPIIVDPPYLLKNYLGVLYLKARDIVLGEYDNYANCTAERESIKLFKDRYSDKIQNIRMTDIGFEDYYLIHDLVCHKTNTQNPHKFNIRESMKIAYLHAIYNDGKLNKLFLQYPDKFINYLKGFDNIFTTNYDSNIESATGYTIYHLHGQFDKKAEVYNINSFRNQLPDCPVQEIDIDENYAYLYSNSLTTYCGEYKEFQITQHSLANSAINKMAKYYKSNPKAKEEIDGWTKDTNKLLANLGYSIQLKVKNPELHFSEDYYFDKFKIIEGTLEILGLSPWNDFHIFESIDNSSIDRCIYYYFNKEQCDTLLKLLPNLHKNNCIEFKSVTEFWRTMYEN